MNQVLPSTIELLQKKYENRFHRLCFSKEDIESMSDEWRIVNWYIQTQLDNALWFLNTKDISVFICGKPEMVDDVRAKLMAHGVDGKNIKFEKY